MTNIRASYNNIIVKLQEYTYTIGASKRIKTMSEYIELRPSDILLDIGGNTGKITEAYSGSCKEVVVLEPKHSIVEYGRSHRPNIKFIEVSALIRFSYTFSFSLTLIMVSYLKIYI